MQASSKPQQTMSKKLLVSRHCTHTTLWYATDARFVPIAINNKCGDNDGVMVQDASEQIDLIITADTVVILDDEIIGKPKSEADAMATLRRLSGRSHEVVTAIVLLLPAHKAADYMEEPLTIVRSASTEVRFATLSESDITAYVQTGDPMYSDGMHNNGQQRSRQY
jgi:hypothetical protein